MLKLSFALLLLYVSVGYSTDEYFLYFKKPDVEKLKKSISIEDSVKNPYVNQLKLSADLALQEGPWSIADSVSPSISQDPNDYYSEGPYWWPDPNNPGGPYIRKDGQLNPHRFIAHRSMLSKMYQVSFALIIAGYLFDDRRYTAHALQILSAWFIDPQKRMNPHMNYAQAIPNKTHGRGIGIIDAYPITKLIEAFYILDMNGNWPGEHKEKIKQWFKQFLNWLTTSKNGLDERGHGNNHTTWWCALVAAISRFVDDEQVYQSVYNYLETEVINEQIEENGSMPHEEKRTRSYDYVCFNLDAFSLVMQNYYNRGLDLWDYENEASGSVKKAIAHFYPFASGLKNWPYQQITKQKEKAGLFWFFAAKRFHNQAYLDLYKRKMPVDALEDKGSGYDPFLLLLNLLLTE